MIRNGEDGIVALRWGKFGDEIDCNGLERQIACRGDRKQGWFCWMRIDFIHLAGCAAFDVGCNKVSHVGPPVVLFDQVDGFGNSRVSCGKRIMKKVCYPPPKTIVLPLRRQPPLR